MKSHQELEAKSRLYRVECFESPVEGDDRFKYSRWGLHHQFGVVCHSAVEAMDFIREKHSTYRIDAVNQVGFANYVLDTSFNGDGNER